MKISIAVVVTLVVLAVAGAVLRPERRGTVRRLERRRVGARFRRRHPAATLWEDR
jgi:hypothetical protein